jgi:hypothetical protein
VIQNRILTVYDHRRVDSQHLLFNVYKFVLVELGKLQKKEEKMNVKELACLLDISTQISTQMIESRLHNQG